MICGGLETLVRQTSTDQGNNRDDSGKCSEQKGCLNYFEGWRWRLQNIAGPVNTSEDEEAERKIKPEMGLYQNR